MSELLINLLTSLLLVLQQAFVVQAEPFTPHQRRSLAAACHPRQSSCLSATKETQQARPACQWLIGKGGEAFSLVISCNR